MPSFIKDPKHYFNLANSLSWLRIFLIPLVLALMSFQYPLTHPQFSLSLAYSSALFFVLAGISDLIDGYMARRYHLTSNFGKLLDPLADKLMHLGVLIFLIPLQELPAWIVVLLLSREVAVTGLRGIAASEGVVLAADTWGKKKTVCLNISLTCFLLPAYFFGASSRAVGWPVLLLALALSLYSGFKYFFNYFKK